jgi:hypothetical protein
MPQGHSIGALVCQDLSVVIAHPWQAVCTTLEGLYTVALAACRGSAAVNLEYLCQAVCVVLQCIWKQAYKSSDKQNQTSLKVWQPCRAARSKQPNTPQ